jgi:hypothetical protein
MGGSPCSGKSTVAELLAQKYNLYYFKVDDFLEKYTDLGAARNDSICKKQKEMSPEETWMRDPVLQCAEEFQFYSEIFNDIIKDIKKIRCESNIIAEGAAFCPGLMKEIGIHVNEYMAVIPEPNFQIAHYSQREWVPFVLDGCSDKEKAFFNWMQRDILFAQRVERECKQEGYYYIVNNGEKSIEELAHAVSSRFGFEG